MSFNGAGTFTVFTPGTPYVTGTVISSTVANNVNTDFATGLTNCVTRDGQSPATANLPMGGFKLTGLGVGTLATDSARVDQIQSSVSNWVAAGGTADAITATYNPAVTALVDGQLFFFRASAANATTTPTFSPNGLTARTITRLGGSALLAGDIPNALAEVIIRYNLANTRYEILNPAAFASRGVNTDITSMSALTSTSGAGTLTLGNSGGVAVSGAGGLTVNGGNLLVSRSNPAGNVSTETRNNDGANNTSNALNYVHVNGATSGDPMTWYSVDGAGTWAVGLDNSVNDSFKISNGTALGTNDALAIDTSLNIWAGGQTVATANNAIYSVTTARAWVNFNGTGTAAIRKSVNVSGLTDNGTGDYTITFSNAIADANCAVVMGVRRDAATSQSWLALAEVATPITTTSVRVKCTNAAGGAQDPDYAMLAVFD